MDECKNLEFNNNTYVKVYDTLTLDGTSLKNSYHIGVESLILKWKKINEKAIIPQYQNKGDAGFDLHALINEDTQNVHKDNKGYFVSVIPKSQMVIETGLSCEMPEGWQMEIRPRSGLAFKHKITITNAPGTIDSGYKNQIMVLIFNLGEYSFKIYNEDRIAQGVMMPAPQFIMKEVDELNQEDRGGGFGSTGI